MQRTKGSLSPSAAQAELRQCPSAGTAQAAEAATTAQRFPRALHRPRSRKGLRHSPRAPGRPRCPLSPRDGDVASEKRDRPRGAGPGCPSPRCRRLLAEGRQPARRTPGPLPPQSRGSREGSGPDRALRGKCVRAPCVRRGGQRPSWSRAGGRPAPPAAAISPHGGRTLTRARGKAKLRVVKI